VGCGKTTTLRAVLEQLGPDVLAVFLFNPVVSAQEFFKLLARGLGLEISQSISKADLLTVLDDFLAARHNAGLRTALIIDEAHSMPAPLLEEVRLLMNFETPFAKLLQVILCGQPELRDTLNRPEFRQLKQRISLRCSIKELTLFEAEKYIRFRLMKAGARRVDLFDRAASRLIGHVSRGIPRVISNICDNALLCGFGAGREVITYDVVEEVLNLLDLTPVDDLRAFKADSSGLHGWNPLENPLDSTGNASLPKRPSMFSEHTMLTEDFG
jgi:general secretion pathway protein A